MSRLVNGFWSLPAAIALSLLAGAGLAACSKKAESTQQVNRDFQVDTLFTHDGCTVYRFNDGGASRYFTNCKGSTQWQEGCGKNCTRGVEVLGVPQ